MESLRPTSVPLKIEPLLSPYTAGYLAPAHIVHHQLRHLVVCPLRRGVVYIADYFAIQKVNLLDPHDVFGTVVPLNFLPTCIAAIPVPGMPNAILFAAGGITSELYLGLYVCDEGDSYKPVWESDTMSGQINDNAVVFVPPGLLNTKRTIKLFECRNDGIVCVYSIMPYVGIEVDPLIMRLRPCGSVELETLPNYVSLSPDGKVLVCVGDTDKAYLYSLAVDEDDDQVTFTPMTTYALPPPTPAFFAAVTVPLPPHFRSRACFSAAWSADGSRFAIASQEGQLTVWDVRTSDIVFNNWSHTPFMSELFNDGAGADGIRSVKFCKPPHGREILLWTEHSDNVHAIDADTFDLATHCIMSFPNLEYLRGSAADGPGPQRVDIAGMCLDPTQEWLYVAASDGIAEFHVNG